MAALALRALQRNGFRALAGAYGTEQPPDLADDFLHETVVAWVRKWFAKHPFKAADDIDKNYDLFLDRQQQCEAHINDGYDVSGLCYDAVKRLQELCAKKGGRMKT